MRTERLAVIRLLLQAYGILESLCAMAMWVPFRVNGGIRFPQLYIAQVILVPQRNGVPSLRWP